MGRALPPTYAARALAAARVHAGDEARRVGGGAEVGLGRGLGRHLVHGDIGEM